MPLMLQLIKIAEARCRVHSWQNSLEVSWIFSGGVVDLPQHPGFPYPICPGNLSTTKLLEMFRAACVCALYAESCTLAPTSRRSCCDEIDSRLADFQDPV